MDTTIETQNVISFCTGIRGLERGLERTSLPIRTVCYVETEAFIIANLVAAMETGVLAEAPIWTDLRTFEGFPFRGLVHGITGGYPCTPFSHAGKRKGEEDPRHLFPYILNAINIIRPVWCFFENVPGHLSLGYDEVYRSLSDLGYSVDCGIFSAREVGATQLRERLFILAIRKDIMANSKHSGDRASEYADFRGWQKSVFGQVGYPINRVSGQGEDGSQSEEKELHGAVGGDTVSRGGGSEVLGDTDIKGLQGGELDRASDEGVGQSEPCEPISKPSYSQWVAPPGRPQWDWEEPRTIKPSLVHTIDGYNFKEDLLRAIGNSVVEQTAELAFLTLSRKHYESIKKD